MIRPEIKIYYQPKLTAQELEEIYGLQKCFSTRGVNCKIDPGLCSGILGTQNSAVAGFMTVDCFGWPKIESAALVETPVLWRGMEKVLLTYAKEKKAEEILYICDPNDTMLANQLEAKGLVPSFSEYRMRLDKASFSPSPVSGVSLRPAANDDRAYILQLDKVSFGPGIAEISHHELKNTQIILYNSRPAGKLRLDETDGTCGIYGVVVEDQMRGQGIGAQALTLLLECLIKAGVHNVYLEVDSENHAAFHLYEKLGFKVSSVFDYYACSL